MLKTTLLNGITTEKDKDYTELGLATVKPGVIAGLEVTLNSISAGIWFIKATRTATTPEEDILVKVEITEAYTIDTSGTNKVWIEINQNNINDPALNDAGGSTAWTIEEGASYPVSGYYIPLADIVAGTITDNREAVTIKAKGINGAEVFLEVDAWGTEITLKKIDGDEVDLKVENLDALTDILINGVGTNTALGLLKLNSSGKVDSGFLEAIPIKTTTVQKIAGEDLANNDEVYLEDLTNFATATDLLEFWDLSEKISFFSIWNWISTSAIKLAMKKIWAPTGTLTFRLETDNAGEPSGTLVHANATGTLDGATLTTSLADTTINLAGSVTFSDNIKYWVVVSLPGAVNTSNYYAFGQFTQVSGVNKYWNWSAWVDVIEVISDLPTLSSSGATTYRGIKFTPTKSGKLTTVQVASGYGGTSGVLKSDAGSTLQTRTKVGNTLTFDYDLVAGTYYRLYCTGVSTSYYVTPATPVTYDYINVYGATNESTGDLDDYIFNIEDITLEISDIDKTYTDSTWLYGKYLYKTDASDVNKIKLIWFIEWPKLLWNIVNIKTAWVSENHTGLTIGAKYYLSNTPGLISTSPGSNSVMVGRAISETEILINAWGF